METNRTTALIIPLPTAATSLIDNPTKRRGRYPRGVIPFAEVRNRAYIRKMVREEIEEEEMLLHNLMLTFNRTIVRSKCRISELRMQGGAA
jgi:hypothetical protein